MDNTTYTVWIKTGDQPLGGADSSRSRTADGMRLSVIRRTLLLLAALLLAGCNLSNQTPTAVPTPNLPRVQFQSPANESTVYEGTDLAIQILAEDSGIGIARVELLADEQHVQEARPEISAAGASCLSSISARAWALSRPKSPLGA